MLRFTNGMTTRARPIEYKGKVLMMLVNDPPATEDEPNLFGGKALTYYGRWTYKYRRGRSARCSGRNLDPHDRIRRIWLECCPHLERQLALRDRPNKVGQNAVSAM